MDYSLSCLTCDTAYKSTYPRQICECGGILEVSYQGKMKRITRNSFWDYEDYLPEGRYRHYEVGNTRLLKHSKNLFLKLENENPTRSFKDRGSVVEVAKAHEYGYREIVCASTGNMAYSVAYYARLYGLKTKIFLSHDAGEEKVANIRKIKGTRFTKVHGDFTLAQLRAIEYSGENDAFLAGDYCYRQEGQGLMILEILKQLPDVTHLIVPVGNATLLSGILKLMIRMRDSGLLKRIPKTIGVEAEGSSPLVRAYKNKRRIIYEKPRTRADAIAVGFPTYGDLALDELKIIGGSALAVSDNEMLLEQKRFAKETGLAAELGGVAALAAYRKLSFRSREKAVAIISGGNASLPL